MRASEKDLPVRVDHLFETNVETYAPAFFSLIIGAIVGVDWVPSNF